MVRLLYPLCRSLSVSGLPDVFRPEFKLSSGFQAKCNLYGFIQTTSCAKLNSHFVTLIRFYPKAGSWRRPRASSQERRKKLLIGMRGKSPPCNWLGACGLYGPTFENVPGKSRLGAQNPDLQILGRVGGRCVFFKPPSENFVDEAVVRK